MASKTFEVHPLTPERYADLEELFGDRGACGGCWCMYWRRSKAEYEANRGASNCVALRTMVNGGTVPGLIGYAHGLPVAWCSLGPKDDFVRLPAARAARNLGSDEVWSVVCFFVLKAHRGKGFSARLLRAAAKFAKQNGASELEGYPVVPREAGLPDVFAYTGLPSAFRKTGFEVVARPSDSRLIMRLDLKKRRRKAAIASD